MNKILDEVKEITAAVVAQKQEVAKLNFHGLIKKIKEQASYGNSYATFPISQINEFDKKLLEAEGFKVFLQDVPMNKYNSISPYSQFDGKQWRVTW